MADRIVTWKALADFSKVRKEAGQTQASLAALQAQVDKNNASNKALGNSTETLANKERSSNVSLAASLSTVAKARENAVKAENDGIKAATKGIDYVKREDTALRVLGATVKQTTAEKDKSTKATLAAERAALLHESALRKEQLTLNSLNNATNNHARAKDQLARASYAAADAETRLMEVIDSDGVHSKAAADASTALTRARNAEEDAARRVETATLRLSNAHINHEASLARVTQAAMRANSAVENFDHTLKGAAGGDGGRFGTVLNGLSDGFRAFQNAAGGASAVMGLLKFGMMAAGIIELVSAVSALVSGLFALTSAIAPAIGGLAALGTVAAAGVGAFASIKMAFSGVGNAMKAYTNQQAQAGTAAVKSANQQINAAQAIARAQRQLKSAREQVGVTERNTAQSIASAAHTVVEARYAEKEAEKSLAQARKDALQNILDLKQAVIDAALAEKGATLGLADAQANLQRIMNDPNSTRLQREQAQLAVDNAQNQVSTTQTASEKSKKAYTDAATKGVEGSDAVKKAKHDEANAIYQVAQAQQAYTNAVQDGARANRQALQAVKDAAQSLADAQRSAAQQAATGTGANNAYATALKKLTPAQRQMVKELIATKDAYKSVKNLAAEDMLPGMTNFLKSSRSILPQVKVFIGDTSTALGSLATQAGRMISNKQWKDSFTQLGKSNVTVIHNLGDAFLRILDLFRAISVAAIPLTAKLTKGFDEWVKSMDKAHSSAAGMEKMKVFFEKTYTVLHQLGQIFKEIGIGLMNTGRAASSSGKSMLDSIQNIVTKWANWTKTVQGQDAMKKYFAAVRTNVAAVAHLLGVITKIFIDLGANKTLAPFATGLTNIINQMKTFFAGFGGADTGKKVGDIFKNLVDALKTLGSTGGTTLSVVVDLLDLLSKALVGILKVPGAGDVLIAIAGAFALFKGLQITAQITQMDKLFKVASQFTKGFGATTGSVMSRIRGGLSRIGVSDKEIDDARANGQADPVNRPTRIARAIRRRTTQGGNDRGGTLPGTGGAPIIVPSGGGSNENDTQRNRRRVFGRRRTSNPVDDGVRAANGGRDDAIRIMNNAAGGAPAPAGGAPSEEEGSGRPSRRQRVGAIAGRGAAAAGAVAGVAAMAAQIPALSKYSGLLNTISIVAGLAAAAQALLNLAMEASPVMLIVTGIALLVAGIIYAYNHFKTFRVIVQDIGKVFTWLWKNVLSPAIDWIIKHWQILAVGLAVILGPIGLIGAAIALLVAHWREVWGVIQSVWNTVWNAILSVWNSVGKPVFDAIAAVVTWLWKTALSVIFTAIQVGWQAVMTYFQVWWAIGKAVFNAFIAIAQFLWSNVLSPIWNLIKAAWKLLMLGLKTEWEIGKAVFNAISDLAKWLWKNALAPAFNGVKTLFHDLWSGITTIWNNTGAPIFSAIGSAWDAVKTAFSGAWTWLKNGFGTFVGAFGKIWSGIEDLFMAPVKFVVNTVIDGWLIDNINSVLDFLGIHKIPEIPRIGGGGGSGGGGGTGGNHGSSSNNSAGLTRADGGWIPGHTGTASRVPGTGNRDSVPAMLMPGEFVIRKRAAETLGHDTLSMLNRADGANVPGGPAPVSGGRQHFFLGGLVGDIADLGKAAWNSTGGALVHLGAKWARKGVEGTLRGIMAPLRGTMHATLGHLGWPGKMASGTIDKGIEALLSFVGGADQKRATVESGMKFKAQMGASLDSKQFSNAQAVAAAGRAMGMSARDIEVAFMTAMTESKMRNLANPSVPDSMNLPHDGIGTDHDSVGLFQQRNSWGSAATRLNPSATSRLFFNRLKGLGPGRNKMGMGAEAQAVQVSAFPDAYNAWQDWSTNLYNLMNTANDGGASGSTGGNKHRAMANGGPVLAFHSGGVVPHLGPGYNNNAMSAWATQAGLNFPAGSSGWSGSLAAQLKKRMSGVNKFTEVGHTGTFPTAQSLLSPDSGLTKGLMHWVDVHDPKTYNALWSQQPYGKSAAMPNSYHKNPLLPLLSYVGGTTAWKNYRKNAEASYWANKSASDKKADAAWNKNKKHKRKHDYKYDLASEKKRHPNVVSGFQKSDAQWAKDLTMLSKAASTEKGRVAQMRTYLGLKGGGNNGGLFSADMTGPLDHVAAHALGMEHPADWAHPWSGSVTSVESAIANSDRSNALNAEWYKDLQTIATWGMPDLLQYLTDKGITDGLQIARDAVKSKSSAQQLNDSIKAGKSGFGGLTGSDQDTALKIVAKLSSGTKEKPFGLRDVSSMLQTPDFAVVNMFDKMSGLLKQIDPSKLTKFNNDVGLFRQGLFYAATGGKVPGTGSGDTVPAMLTPGEFVVRKKAVEALGMGTLHQINQADQQHFATGGPVLAPSVSAMPSLSPGALSVHTPKVTAPGGNGNTYVTEINTEINNPTGENSVYSMNQMLRRKAATGQFDRNAKNG